MVTTRKEKLGSERRLGLQARSRGQLSLEAEVAHPRVRLGFEPRRRPGGQCRGWWSHLRLARRPQRRRGRCVVRQATSLAACSYVPSASRAPWPPGREWPGARVLARPWPKPSSVRIEGKGFGWNSEAAVSAIFASFRGAVVTLDDANVAIGEVRTKLWVHETRVYGRPRSGRSPAECRPGC